MTDIDLLVRGGVLYPMTEGSPVIAGGEVAIQADGSSMRDRRSPPATGRRSKSSTALVASCCPGSSTVTATLPP